MDDFTPDYQIRVNQNDLIMPIGTGNITEPEILEAARSPQAKWYESANLPRQDGGCFLIAPTSKRRFLLVALSCPDGNYVIHRVKRPTKMKEKSANSTAKQPEPALSSASQSSNDEAWKLILADTKPISREEAMRRLQEAAKKE